MQTGMNRSLTQPLADTSASAPTPECKQDGS